MAPGPGQCKGAWAHQNHPGWPSRRAGAGIRSRQPPGHRQRGAGGAGPQARNSNRHGAISSTHPGRHAPGNAGHLKCSRGVRWRFWRTSQLQLQRGSGAPWPRMRIRESTAAVGCGGCPDSGPDKRYSRREDLHSGAAPCLGAGLWPLAACWIGMWGGLAALWPCPAGWIWGCLAPVATNAQPQCRCTCMPHARMHCIRRLYSDHLWIMLWMHQASFYLNNYTFT